VVQHVERERRAERKADNWTAFTDGHWTWVNGPWEAAETAPPPSRAPGPPPAAIPTPRSTITAGGLELVDMVAGWGRDQQGNHLPFIRFRAINRTNDVIRYPDDRLFFSATFVNAALGETTDAIGALPIDLSGIRPGFGGTVDLWGARGYVSGVARSQLPALKVELYHGNPIGGNRRPIGVFDLRP
jgi:hypothetical protein